MRILRRILGIFFVLGIIIGSAFAQDATASPTASEGNVVVVASAFVRSGPADSFVAVGALYAGDTVRPLNISEDGFWILIPYSRGNGWIQRNLVRWEDDAALELLPVMPANITPTPRVEVTNTPFIPTFTPEGNYVNPSNAQSVYLRAGPGRGYLRLGQLRPSDTVIPLARNADTTWIMIRFQNTPFQDGFAWVAADLITWEDPASLADLPIVEETNLTPTATFTASITPSITQTPAPSSTASATSSMTTAPTATAEASATATNTNTATTAPTATSEASATATETNTATATHTATLEPTATATSTASTTLEPSATASSTATNTPEATATDTATTAPTETNTATTAPSATHTATTEPTTEAAVVVVFPSETATTAPSNTPEPSATATETLAPTDIFALQSTAVVLNATAEPSPAPLVEETVPQAGFSLPIEAIVGLIVLLIIALYIGLYMQGLSAAARYKAGFVVDRCPVCQRGHLHIEERPNRLLGIPMTRRTVRCDECRSVLRETGNRRWRYAVDRIENPLMYERFNGKEVSDADLERLLKQPPKNAGARTNPSFVDDEQGK